MLGGSTGNTVKVWDLNKKEEKYCKLNSQASNFIEVVYVALSGHENVVQSFCWHGNGSLLATVCKVGGCCLASDFDYCYYAIGQC